MRPHFSQEIWERLQCRPPLACHFRLIFWEPSTANEKRIPAPALLPLRCATFRTLNPSGCFSLLFQAPPKPSEPGPRPWTAADNTWSDGTGMSRKKTDRIMSFNRQGWKGTDENGNADNSPLLYNAANIVANSDTFRQCRVVSLFFVRQLEVRLGPIARFWAWDLQFRTMHAVQQIPCPNARMTRKDCQMSVMVMMKPRRRRRRPQQ